MNLMYCIYHIIFIYLLNLILFIMKMRIIANLNNKGGVGKTTSAAGIAAYMSYVEKKVLLIDFDPQANLTAHFNFDVKELKETIHTAIVDFKDDPETAKLPLLKINECMYLVPSEPNLELLRENIGNYAEPNRILQHLLKPFEEHFDVCIIDLPPAKDVYAKNALFACDDVLIPIQAAKFSLDGVNTLVSFLMKLKKQGFLNFEIIGSFLSMYDERKLICTETKQVVSAFFKEKMFDTVIRVNTDIEKAQAEGEDIFVYAKNSNAAADYGNLTEEILKRIKLN